MTTHPATTCALCSLRRTAHPETITAWIPAPVSMVKAYVR